MKSVNQDNKFAEKKYKKTSGFLLENKYKFSGGQLTENAGVS